MRGTRAKQLRALATIACQAQKLPDKVYETQKVLKTVILPGPTKKTVVIEVQRLGRCKRKVYQVMKRIYKAGGLIDDQVN